ncbi:SDR family NAD(P)-dependent oxidoreductase [Nocardioides jishulii]|uniref:SDR family oxidoreductase n=1 Tax=Nocardioides jishulii TaxID=2575440 RepID=A0A4U2YRR5_9ACTN|nr:SDR family oxidoreductase [Nocardioides jishulii]QCX26559.1 SDR family oxidoreductase [Nocardioides jishulii]TKI63634.1 SDR family oxidoreductase [Nocardioides jishulii]
MDLGLLGAGALVTGGNRGIGRATAAALTQEGAHVVLLGRDEASLAQAVEETGAVGHVVADTTDDATVRAAVAAAVQRLGRLDVVVNCAAPRAVSGAPTGLEELDEADVLTHVDTKVLGYLRVVRAAAPHLRERGGQVVNISGTNARVTGNVGGSIRNIGVVALTKNLADELGPDGVSVVCVHPGLTVTERNAGDAAYAEQAAASNALGVAQTAADVAALVTFLASPLGRVANGAVVTADGGRPGHIWA